MRLMIVVTHLLGTGHLGRALTLGRAFAAAGHDVCVASGGRPAPHLDSRALRLVQLPSLASDGTNFARLLDEAGNEVGPVHMAARREVLRALLEEIRPDVLITELYPFGRRMLRHEFLDLLQAAKGRVPLVLSSVRDILAPPSKPARAEAAADVLATHYSGVLVHSDPAVTPLDISWPVPARVSNQLIYTGFVAQQAPAPHPEGLGRGEILVSAGGGNVGDPIFDAAIETARMRPDLRLRLLVGGGAGRVARWTETAGSSAIVEAVRPDFRQMLACADASVSMCGYNTAMDLLQTGCPSVIVPFDAGNEVEQGLRAQSLGVMDGFATVSTADLTGARLAAALDRVLAVPRRTAADLRFDGAEETCRIVARMLEARA